MPKKYSIEFRTDEIPGKMIVTHVEIYREIIDMKTEDAKAKVDQSTFNVALADDPNYACLQRYVKGNPR